jgi:hypothetical protein
MAIAATGAISLEDIRQELILLAGGVMPKIATFKSSGNFTVPAGCTYIIAHMIGGGGGGAGSEHASRMPGGTGGASKVNFPSGQVISNGGSGAGLVFARFLAPCTSGTANSGSGCSMSTSYGGSVGGGGAQLAPSGKEIVAGSAVSPGQSIAVTVGAGGAEGLLNAQGGTGNANGGSGYVYLEY